MLPQDKPACDAQESYYQPFKYNTPTILSLPHFWQRGALEW